MMRDLPTLRQKLADARQEVRNLTVMAMRPDLKPATSRQAWPRRSRAAARFRPGGYFGVSSTACSLPLALLASQRI